MDLILTIASIHLIACLSPGPDIFLVVVNSLRTGWRTGVATTLGILCGVSLHITLGITGISYLLTRGPVISQLVGLAGGAALAWLGLLGIRHWRRQPAVADPGIALLQTVPPLRGSFTQGLVINLLNPKALLFFLSIFSVMLGPDVPMAVRIGAGLTMITVQGIAFSLVAVLVDRPAFRQRWFRLQAWLDLGISSLLLLIGIWIWAHTLLALLQ